MDLFIKTGTPEDPGNQVGQINGFSEAFLPNKDDDLVINNTRMTVTQRVFGYANGVWVVEIFVA